MLNLRSTAVLMIAGALYRLDFRTELAMVHRTACSGDHTCNLLQVLDRLGLLCSLPYSSLLRSELVVGRKVVGRKLGPARCSCFASFRHTAIRNHIVEPDRAATSTGVDVQA